jgi:uncharacterized protein YunC (DUF1805 family)
MINRRWIIALALCIGGGCARTIPDAPVADNISPAPDSSSNGDATPLATEQLGDGFWRGLERHEIPLEQTLLLVKGSHGVVACPYLNIATFERTGEACAIVPAATIDGMPDSKVTAVTPKAKELGIAVGMSGREALDKIR